MLLTAEGGGMDYLRRWDGGGAVAVVVMVVVVVVEFRCSRARVRFFDELRRPLFEFEPLVGL